MHTVAVLVEPLTLMLLLLLLLLMMMMMTLVAVYYQRGEPSYETAPVSPSTSTTCCWSHLSMT